MWQISCLLTGWALFLGVKATEHFYRSGRRICSAASHTGAVSVTESYVQPIHKPLITLCEGHRICSTYRTTYKISYRQVPKRTSFPLYSCCPGWRRIESHTHGCSKVSCQLPCLNGGVCSGVNKCDCPAGWSGNYCQTDVDECASGVQKCTQRCINTPGSFQCECLEGFQLLADGRSCLRVAKPTEVQLPHLNPSDNETGVPDALKEEMQELKSKVEVLEQKLQLVLAPFHSLLASSDDNGDPISLLTHSFQQLDRIDSLSEQISFLEERLETCSCKNEL